MASVFLSELDGDWISPSQACTNPIFVSPKTSTSSKLVLEMEPLSSTVLSAGRPPQPNLIANIPSGGGITKASVSLNDCLACSGCVTSAEAVLITQQSNERFLEAIRSGKFSVVVVSLSPQTRASLASSLELSSEELVIRLKGLLGHLGVHLVTDTSISEGNLTGKNMDCSI